MRMLKVSMNLLLAVTLVGFAAPVFAGSASVATGKRLSGAPSALRLAADEKDEKKEEKADDKGGEKKAKKEKKQKKGGW
jgi:hypothetical protein